MNRHDLDYYQQRERQERLRAERARDCTARRVHLELADRYRTKFEQAAEPTLVVV